MARLLTALGRPRLVAWMIPRTPTDGLTGSVAEVDEGVPGGVQAGEGGAQGHCPAGRR
jgi:hypothetical protein